MAVKGFAVIDGIQWEGASTLAFHVVYVGINSTNPHTPGEVFDLMWVTGVSSESTQAQIEVAVADAVETKLTNDHGITFGPLDTVRLVGGAL